MELLIVMLVCGVIAIPVMAIVALVRTSRLRDGLDERFSEQMDRIRDLEAQISSLRRDLNQAQERSKAQDGPSVGAAAVADSRPAKPAPQMQAAGTAQPAAPPESVRIAPVPAAPPAATHSIPAAVAPFQTHSPAQAMQSLTPMEPPKPVEAAPVPRRPVPVEGIPYVPR
jgi:hypothetical protein